MTPRTRRTFRKLHRWAGWVIGVQVLLWFASGLFMTLPPIHKVRGNHLLQPPAAVAPLPPSAVANALAAHPDATRLSVATVAGTPLVKAATPDGERLLDAEGRPFTATEAIVRTVAETRYAGDGTLATLRLLDTAPLDWRGDTPIWQAQFDDASRTRFYIDPDSAEVLRVRTRLWRVFDTAWMLHIMGYPDRDNFNTWWLRLFAFAAVLFAITGLALLVPRRRLRA